MELVNFSKKIQKLHIQIIAVILKMTSFRTIKKKIEKKGENPRFYGQNKLFNSSMPFSPWAILATRMHVGAPQKTH
jgi:hypothetical protein